MFKYTIALVVENQESKITKILDKILASIPDNMKDDTEVLVFDNASTDRTLALCDNYLRGRIFGGLTRPDLTIYTLEEKRDVVYIGERAEEISNNKLPIILMFHPFIIANIFIRIPE